MDILIQNQVPRDSGNLINDAVIKKFNADGFVILPDIIGDKNASELATRFEALFKGEFQTGLQPDEWNWRSDRDHPHDTRQICNGWKSDLLIAETVLNSTIAAACATLAGWPGARLAQDNLLWKPPNGKSIGFHQDASYTDWVVPAEMISCWISLDEASSDRGTVNYVRGSHLWTVSPPIEKFHAPNDPLMELEAAARCEGKIPELVPVEVSAGGGAIHHGGTWHGSLDEIEGKGRRSLVIHCISSDAHFHNQNIGQIYGRYRRAGTLQMDETFFPILWTKDGSRSTFINAYLLGGWGGV